MIAIQSWNITPGKMGINSDNNRVDYDKKGFEK
jgi:hypothetical protein